MSEHFSNISGITGASFRFGADSEAPVLTRTPEGIMFDTPIQIKNRDGTAYIPRESQDLSTVGVAQDFSEQAYVAACNFSRNLLLQYGAGNGNTFDFEANVCTDQEVLEMLNDVFGILVAPTTPPITEGG